jgi:hypothetical protein
LKEINNARSSDKYKVSLARKTIDVVGALSSYLLPRTPREKFVIFGQGRCGSTLLTTLLDSHPDIRCEDELLSMRYWQPLTRLARYKNLAQRKSKVFGFHLKPWHIERVYERSLLDFCLKMDKQGYNFIHLKRRNIFLQSLSQAKLHLYGIVQSNSSPRTDKKEFYVDPKLVIFLMEEKELIAKGEALIIPQLSKPVFEVTYEDDLWNSDVQKATTAKLFSHLGLKAFESSTPLKKVSPRDWRLGVENAEKIEAEVRKTPYAKFL